MGDLWATHRTPVDEHIWDLGWAHQTQGGLASEDWDTETFHLTQQGSCPISPHPPWSPPATQLWAVRCNWPTLIPAHDEPAALSSPPKLLTQQKNGFAQFSEQSWLTEQSDKHWPSPREIIGACSQEQASLSKQQRVGRAHDAEPHVHSLKQRANSGMVASMAYTFPSFLEESASP